LQWSGSAELCRENIAPLGLAGPPQAVIAYLRYRALSANGRENQLTQTVMGGEGGT